MNYTINQKNKSKIRKDFHIKLLKVENNGNIHLNLIKKRKQVYII